MNLKECNKCGYRTITSIEKEQKCKKCGGLMIIIAKEKTNEVKNGKKSNLSR